MRKRSEFFNEIPSIDCYSVSGNTLDVLHGFYKLSSKFSLILLFGGHNMEKTFTENDYIRCDIVTGRLYRCLTSLFQEFLDIQFSDVLGASWINNVVHLAENITGDNMRHERNNLKALLKKRDEKSLVLMDKTCIDITIAGTLMLYTCYFLVAVPQYNGLTTDDMVDILHICESRSKTEYNNCDTMVLRNNLVECIKSDITVILKCQEKMSRGRQKNGNIESEDFYKKVQKLVNNKNRLNSHMSTVNDPIASEREITDTIMNLEEFLNYLAIAWNYEKKVEFLAKYRKEVSTIRYLRSTTKFEDVTKAINAVIAELQSENTMDFQEDESDEDYREDAFKRCFSLLSNSNNHCAACTALTVESDSMENPCATIMLAFMYYCGWAKGHSSDEILMPITVITNPEEWLAMAEKLKTSNREQAAAYYIGHAIVNDDPSAFAMAGYEGVRLNNYEVSKMCFKYAGKTSQKAQTIYEGLIAMPDEAAFLKWAAVKNQKG